jgi:hypothetical protein
MLWKIAKMFIGLIDLYRRGHDFFGVMHYGPKQIFHNVGLMGIKRRRILP